MLYTNKVVYKQCCIHTMLHTMLRTNKVAYKQCCIQTRLRTMLYRVLVNRETKLNGSLTHKFTTSAQAHHSTRIFSCAIWLTPGLDSVSEVRLMLFSVYSLLWQLSLVPRLSPLRRGRAWYIYHMRDVKGRHELITRGWTKLDAHAHSNTSVFKTPRVFFSGKYDFIVLPLCLQSALYSCPRRTSRFLEAVATTRTTTRLAYNTTNHEISCHSARQVPCLML